VPDPVSATTTPADTDRDAAYRRKRSGRHRKNQRRIPRWVEYPALIILVGLITFSVQTFLFRVYVIPSESMEQTLYGCTGCTDDRVLVDRLVYDFKTPQPGDVVVFKGPPGWTDNEVQSGPPTTFLGKVGDSLGQLIGLTPAAEVDFVKRVIAVGGQTIYCCDANNHVVVAGKPLIEPYLYWFPGRGTKQAAFGPITVPPGELFVMGDNRNDSDDSRIQAGGGKKGAVPVSDVIGKVRTIIWPFNRISGVGDQNPQASALIGVLPLAVLTRRRRRKNARDPAIGRHVWWHD
jgi:signal peptidase I